MIVVHMSPQFHLATLFHWWSGGKWALAKAGRPSARRGHRRQIIEAVAAVDAHVLRHRPQPVRGVEVAVALHVVPGPPGAGAVLDLVHLAAEVVEIGPPRRAATRPAALGGRGSSRTAPRGRSSSSPSSCSVFCVFSDVSTNCQHSSRVTAAGTSVKACLPACIASTHIRVCHSQGVAMITMSMSSRWSIRL